MYHGQISRGECESVLSQKDRPGLFLVRASSSVAGGYVLSVREASKISHYIINFNQGTGVYKIGDQTFDDLPSIVEFYKKHFLDTTTLVEPAIRPGYRPPGEDGGKQPPATPAPAAQIHVKAKFNFVGNDPEDLSFKKGDILTILKKEEEDWWFARHSNGSEGLIPKPYVEEITQLGSSSPNPMPPKGPRGTSYPGPKINQDITGGRYSTGGKDYSQPAIHSMESSISKLPPGPVMARAVQCRDPSFYDPTQLKFKKDDRIRVLRRNDDGIWEGENLENGTKGLFPFRFVEVLMDQS